MAFTMTHVLAAEKVLEYLPAVSDYSTYILGTIAPDAVHANPNYTVELKERSHLFTHGLRWGEIDNWEKAQLWIGNIKEYYWENRYRYNNDFLSGYIVHLIVDVYSNKKESYGTNSYLLSLYMEKKDLRSVLQAGEAVTLEGIIKKEDIERRIDQLYEFEFRDWDISHIDEYSICRIEDMEQLIQKAAEYVKKVLIDEV